MTGYSAEFGAQLKDLGDDCLILRKPFEPAGLSRMVRQALDT